MSAAFTTSASSGAEALGQGRGSRSPPKLQVPSSNSQVAKRSLVRQMPRSQAVDWAGLGTLASGVCLTLVTWSLGLRKVRVNGPAEVFVLF